MIWLIGNRGMLGRELAELMAERGIASVGSDREVDITDTAALAAFAAANAAGGQPITWIVNCAAYTAVDKAEEERELCRRLNVDGPANIAALAHRIGARLIHLSTDYVFRGDGDRPYREDDPTDPCGFYGLTKRDGEAAVLAAAPDSYILRTSWLYGRHGGNFVYTMLRLMRERGGATVVDDQFGTPTWARDLAETILELVGRGGKLPAGIYHYSGAGAISWYDFAVEIGRAAKERGLVPAGATVKPCTSDQYPAKVRRPAYSVLDKSKIEAALGFSVPDWRLSLASFLAKEPPMRALNNVLVSGGAGFIGGNFIRRLLAATPEFKGRIINLDALTYAGNLSSLEDVEAASGGSRYFFERGDITDRTAVEEVFKKYAIDTVIHFAAESHVDRSILGPEAFIKTNVMGTYTLLDVARLAWRLPDGSMRQDVLFHHVSTDEVYGSLGDSGYFTEATPYDPRSPYSASKASSDHLVFAYLHTYGLPVTLSNCSNNYGPYHFPEKLIPLMILNILAGAPLPVYGDGRQIRDWLYVDDHAAAVWAIVARAPTGEKYNVGGGNEWTNIDLLHKLIDIVAAKAGLDPAAVRATIAYVKDRPGHDRRYAIDASKLQRELGWKPEHAFADGLAKTVDWYLANPEWVRRVRSGEYRDWLAKNYAER
jgi:dTDP-glucose 4,6-dehydratase